MKTPQISSDAFNIIAVGAWNPSILTPEWAKQHLSENDDQDVVLAIPMNLMIGAPCLTVDNVNLYPSLNSLAIDCVQYGDDGLEVVNKLTLSENLRFEVK